MGTTLALFLSLSLSQVTWGTKQTLSEHCNPAFPRFLALGNWLTHSAERERECERERRGGHEEDSRKMRKAGEIKKQNYTQTSSHYSHCLQEV